MFFQIKSDITVNSSSSEVKFPAKHSPSLDAIEELVDYRKVNGASESVLRGLASTEI